MRINNSNPAGNSNWAWRWMGLTPPPLCYNSSALPEKYQKFKQCFNAYYGIGDFVYWKISELTQLPTDDKVILIKLLLDDLSIQKPEKAIRYIGLDSNDVLNSEIDEFADEHLFFKILTVDECRSQKFPHNNQCRHTNGFHCNDCNTFFATDSEDYIRTASPDECGRRLHNLSVYFYRKEIPVPIDVIDLEKEYNDKLKNAGYKCELSYINIFLDRVNQLYDKYNNIVEK